MCVCVFSPFYLSLSDFPLFAPLVHLLFLQRCQMYSYHRALTLTVPSVWFTAPRYIWMGYPHLSLSSGAIFSVSQTDRTIENFRISMWWSLSLLPFMLYFSSQHLLPHKYYSIRYFSSSVFFPVQCGFFYVVTVASLEPRTVPNTW